MNHPDFILALIEHINEIKETASEKDLIMALMGIIVIDKNQTDLIDSLVEELNKKIDDETKITLKTVIDCLWALGHIGSQHEVI